MSQPKYGPDEAESKRVEVPNTQEQQQFCSLCCGQIAGIEHQRSGLCSRCYQLARQAWRRAAGFRS